MTTIKTPNVTWLDIKNPSPKELKYLAENYSVHPLILEALAKPTVRSQAEDYNGYVYLVLHFPVFNRAKKVSEPVEVDFILTPDTLISVRYENLEPLENFLQKCKSPAGSWRANILSKGTIYLFYYLIKEMYSFSLRQLDHMDEKIDAIEEAIFSGHHKEMLLALSLARSDVLNFLRTLRPQSSVLESLLARTDSFENKAQPYLTDLLGEHRRVLDQAENNRETIEGLQTTNASLLDHKTGEIMKVLTIMAFVTFPLTLLANIFSMNTVVMPIAGQPYDFWIIIGIMLLAVALFFGFFKSKKWL
ncbi:MAG: magnesium transporter CorA family protein [Parcubacteria group bacterium]|uniref:Magnesium transporter CorA family protein n=1 Tax=Candidatus Sungiibacteriota bacterium TaxID=2750080 RepID=A0A9D6DQA7_9BACT|nr:magnesium transporter CorA family protein [Candidatus Sungbacteria bacterium]MBI4118741.1 magnesium transporter CorA family protein [Parcubacteria group bacterium]